MYIIYKLKNIIVFKSNNTLIIDQYIDHKKNCDLFACRNIFIDFHY